MSPASKSWATLALSIIAIPLSASAQSIAEEQRALVTAKTEARAARLRGDQLGKQAQAARDEASRTRAAQAGVAAQVQALEADIAAADARIAIIERLRRAQEARLAKRQGPIVRLIAALQTMARRPAAAVIVQPGSLTDLVHVRALLATVMPVIAERTRGLRAEVARANRLRAGAATALAGLRTTEARLRNQRLVLARLEADQRRRSTSLTNDAVLEQDRAIALGEKARDIVDLMDELGQQASVRETLASLPGPMPRPVRPGDATPAAAASAAQSDRPPYRLPVIGRVITGLGEVSEAGVSARGLTIATQPDAQVVAPARGRVAFAGPYRGFGSIVIIDHGGGWTSLVTSLETITVHVGEAVDQGSPIGRAGASKPTVTVELRRDGTPIDITGLVS